MTTEQKKMGAWGLPFTFPTGKVKSYLNDTVPELEWTRDLINDVYESYKKGILTQGLKPYLWEDSQGTHFEIRDFIVKDTNLDEVTVASVLIAIKDLAQSGEIEGQYWNIVKQKEGPQAGDLVEFFKKQQNMIKWGSIAALVLVGLWFGWPVIKKFRKRMKG
jgi:hypothetical protein